MPRPFLTPPILVAMLLLAACAAPPRVPAPDAVSAWMVYWDAARGLGELGRHGRLFDRVSLFAYELDGAGRPRLAPGLAAALPQFHALARAQGFAPWVTVVNDMRDGETLHLKDHALVHRLLADPERARTHAEALAERAAADGFAGLDLDYERIPPEDEARFRDFVALLAHALAARDLALEVVVEPKRTALPAPGQAGVTVMGYNQHGPHSGPGPRATPLFIAGVAARAAGDAGGTPGMALALGGFRWPREGRAEPVEWATAAAAARDGAERGFFTRVPHLRAADGAELWFEDAESLEAKWQAARQHGTRRLALWRLGGNDENLYRWLENLRARP